MEGSSSLHFRRALWSRAAECCRDGGSGLPHFSARSLAAVSTYDASMSERPRSAASQPPLHTQMAEPLRSLKVKAANFVFLFVVCVCDSQTRMQIGYWPMLHMLAVVCTPHTPCAVHRLTRPARAVTQAELASRLSVYCSRSHTTVIDPPTSTPHGQHQQLQSPPSGPCVRSIAPHSYSNGCTTATALPRSATMPGPHRLIGPWATRHRTVTDRPTRPNGSVST